MTHQVALTFSAEVLPGRREGLARLLGSMAGDPGGNPVIPFGEIPHTHFGRVVLLDATPADEGAATLLMTLDCDATVGQRLGDLVEVAGSGIDELFGACVDYPDAPTPDRRLAYLRAHLRGSRVFYVHAVGRTLEQIRGESRLRAALEDHLDARMAVQLRAGLGAG